MLDATMFYDGLGAPLRVIAVGVLAYVALVAFLRVSGKRTLGKMNAFDLIVTVALGSTLATILLSDGVALVTGLVALGLLIGLQYAVATLQVRSDRFQALVKATPSLLVRDGRILRDVARRERLSDAEILQALRQEGVSSLADAGAVVLETDGTLTVLEAAGPSADALDSVPRPRADRSSDAPTDQGEDVR